VPLTGSEFNTRNVKRKKLKPLCFSNSYSIPEYLFKAKKKENVTVVVRRFGNYFSKSVLSRDIFCSVFQQCCCFCCCWWWWWWWCRCCCCAQFCVSGVFFNSAVNCQLVTFYRKWSSLTHRKGLPHMLIQDTDDHAQKMVI